MFIHSCPHFPLPLSPALNTPSPTFNPPSPSLCLSMGPLYMLFEDTSPFFLLSPSPLPSGCCQFVLYFHVSGSVLLICLFGWLGSSYRWDHVVLVFHCLAYFSSLNLPINCFSPLWQLFLNIRWQSLRGLFTVNGY